MADRPGFWQRASAEDSAGHDIDAGRLVALGGGGAIVLAIIMTTATSVIVALASPATFDPVPYATAIGIESGALIGLLPAAGAYIALKAKGEGQPT